MDRDEALEVLLRQPDFAAAKEASLESEERYKMGAAFSDGEGNVISTGCNKPDGDNPIVQEYYPHGYLHAEIDAVKGLSREEREGGSITIWRNFANGMPALARSCNICYEHLKVLGIKKIRYTHPDSPYFKEEILS